MSMRALAASSDRTHAPALVDAMNLYDDSTDSVRAGMAEAEPLRLVPSDRQLDVWTAEPWTGGLQIEQLAPFDTLTVCTRNSTYTIVVLGPGTGDVLLRGGSHCPTLTRAVLVGATAGGSFVKVRGIYEGLRMEIVIEGRRLVTSPVVRIAGSESHCSGLN
jgi:hypothetical protein